MDIGKLIKEHHEAMVEKGFYTCPECGGDGEIYHCLCDLKKTRGCDYCGDEDKEICTTCDGTGKDQNKNIGELLMLIVSELGEALEAHRKGVYAVKSQIVNITDYPQKADKEAATVQFERFIKDTFEDEIADVFLRLFDLCGYLGILPEKEYKSKLVFGENVAENLGKISSLVLRGDGPGVIKQSWSSFVLSSLLRFSDIMNISIEKHILAKMAYNKTRPHKHGKRY
jgi:NTP pyrophosphatase (non-canonical NTP hydrolase)